MQKHTSPSSADSPIGFVLRHRRTLVWGWTALIAIVMLVPGAVIPKVPEWSDLLTWDKLIHFTLFCVHVILVWLALSLRDRNPGISPGTYALLAAFIGMVFGGSLELMQALLPIGRSGNVFDFIADSAGCLAAYGISWLLTERVNRAT